jgi:hypothetical protein
MHSQDGDVNRRAAWPPPDHSETPSMTKSNDWTSQYLLTNSCDNPFHSVETRFEAIETNQEH